MSENTASANYGQVSDAMTEVLLTWEAWGETPCYEASEDKIAEFRAAVLSVYDLLARDDRIPDYGQCFEPHLAAHAAINAWALCARGTDEDVRAAERYRLAVAELAKVVGA